MSRLVTVLVIGFGLATMVIAASRADEHRARADALRQEAALLAEQGFEDQAPKLLAAAERDRDSEREAERDRDSRRRAADEERAELVERLDREADELHRLGRLADAEHVRARIREIKEGRELHGHRESVHRRLEELHQHLEKLHAKHEALAEGHPDARRGVEQEIEAMEREAVALEQRLHGDHPEHDPGRHQARVDEARHRIEHLHRAAENLAEAGESDLARDLHERAEQLERELRHHLRNADANHGERHSEIRELHSIIRDVRHDVERLRDQVNQLRELVEQERRP